MGFAVTSAFRVAIPGGKMPPSTAAKMAAATLQAQTDAKQVRGPGLHHWSFSKEIVSAACPHAATHVFLERAARRTRAVPLAHGIPWDESGSKQECDVPEPINAWLRRDGLVNSARCFP